MSCVSREIHARQCCWTVCTNLSCYYHAAKDARGGLEAWWGRGCSHKMANETLCLRVPFQVDVNQMTQTWGVEVGKVELCVLFCFLIVDFC